MSAVPPYWGASLPEALAHHAELDPTRVAFRFLADGEREVSAITYAELDARARAIAASVGDLVSAGERVVLLYPPGIEFIAAFLGCLYARIIPVPAYPPVSRRTYARLESVIRDAQPRAILTSGELGGSQMASRHGLLPLLPTLRTDVDCRSSVNFQPTMPATESVAFLQYTSGSTGTPKGVVVTHGNLSANAFGLATAFGMKRESVIVSWLPLYHDMGLMGSALQAVFLGATCVLMAPAAFLQKPIRWLSAISQYGGTHSSAPNFAYELCVDRISEGERAQLDLHTWECAANGAEPVRTSTLSRFAGAFAASGFRSESLRPCYGLAEATLLVSATGRATSPMPAEVDQVDRPSAVSSGGWQGTPETTVAIVDPDKNTRLPESQIGEIWVAGPQVAQGYFQNEAATQQTFGARLEGSPRAYLRTGDLGFVRDGELFVTGRLKDLIIVHGQNHYPQDLEETAEGSHPALVRGGSAAFSFEHEGSEHVGIALELKRDGLRHLDTDLVIRKVCRALAQAHELPISAVALLKPSALPRTSSGKVQRTACRDGFLRMELASVAVWRSDGTAAKEPQPKEVPSDLSAWIRSCLARLLHTSEGALSLDTPFVQLGVTSVHAIDFAAQLGEFLGQNVSPTLLYDHPSIAELARHFAEPPLPFAPARACQSELQSEDDDIAIVGMACRLPGAPDLTAYFEMLCSGGDAVRPAPPERVVRAGHPRPLGGYIDDPFGFDARFFGISANEAASTDPQHRLLLEITQEAFDDAGFKTEALVGSETGVFVGFSSSEYAALFTSEDAAVTSHTATGCFGGIAANRVSYLYDLRGPSYTVDAVCSSALLAAHLACQSIRAGECEQAVVGGVVLMLTDSGHEWFAKLGVISRGMGRCRAFDASADGIVLGEGAAAVVLKRRSRAVADGDRIYAVIKGSAATQDGRSNGLTAPTQRSQERMLQQALTRAKLDAREVTYVDAHGTGTELGDPIEARALGSVLGAGRPADRPLLIGSVKTNIGHCSIVGGLASLIKVAMSIHRGVIPGSLHFDRPNPHVDFAKLGLSVLAETVPWPREGAPRIAGVSALSFGGTNVHVLLAQTEAQAQGQSDASSPQLLVLSAKTPEALRKRALSFRALTATPRSWSDISYTAAMKRSHHEHRLAVVFDGSADLRAALDQWLAGGRPGEVVACALASSAAAPGVAQLVSAAQQFLAGALEGIDRLFSTPRPPVTLPSYPFEHERFAPPSHARWIASMQGAATVHSDDSQRPLPLTRDALVGWLCREIAETLQVERDEVEPENSLADLGYNSLSALELAEKLRDLGFDTVPLESLMSAKSAAALASSLFEPKTATAEPSVDWEHEATLAPEIRAGSEYASSSAAPSQILLTGATGFLGAYLLRELLSQTQAHISCLVRAPSREAGIDRLRKNLQRYGLWQEADVSRLSPALGDLAEPGLGLTAADLALLADRIDTVVHNGAQVTYVLPYRDLRAANVGGTTELLRLASVGRSKTLHFVSTMGLSFPPSSAVVPEDLDLGQAPAHPLGYVQSKWVCERLIREARHRGLKISVYRPAWIGGATGTGECNTEDFLYQFTKGLVELESAPDVSQPLDIVPVDFMARSMVTLFCQPQCVGKDFNLAHPAPMSLRDWLRSLNKVGYPIKIEPLAAWKERLRDCSTKNPLFPLRSLFLDEVPELGTSVYDYYFPDGLDAVASCANTESHLSSSRHAWTELARIDPAPAILRYLKRTGFLPPTQDLAPAAYAESATR